MLFSLTDEATNGAHADTHVEKMGKPPKTSRAALFLFGQTIFILLQWGTQVHREQ